MCWGGFVFMAVLVRFLFELGSSGVPVAHTLKYWLRTDLLVALDMCGSDLETTDFQRTIESEASSQSLPRWLRSIISWHAQQDT